MIRVLVSLCFVILISGCAMIPERAVGAMRNDPPARLDIGEAGRALNGYRRKRGLEPLQLHPQLMAAAGAHAADLARINKVGHFGSDGSNPADRVIRAGYAYSSVGENVSAGRTRISEVIQAWHDSSAHRRVMQSGKAVHFGLAVKYRASSTYSNYWVLVVAAPE